MHLLEVLNPVAEQRGSRAVMPVNSRPSTLDGLKIGLVWSGTHGGDVALNRIGEMLGERFYGPNDELLHGRLVPCAARCTEAGRQGV